MHAGAGGDGPSFQSIPHGEGFAPDVFGDLIPALAEVNPLAVNTSAVVHVEKFISLFS